MKLDVERAPQGVQVLVHLERLADPLAHELLLEHDGLGGMHHGRRREDGVVALDAVQDVPDLRLHGGLEPRQALLEQRGARRCLARQLVLQGELAQREHVGHFDHAHEERRVGGVELLQILRERRVEARQRVIERRQSQGPQVVALRILLPAEAGTHALQPREARPCVEQAALPVEQLLGLPL